MLALLMVSTLVACGDEPQDDTSTPSVVSATEENTEPEPTVEITPDTWGVTDCWSARNGAAGLFYINFPESRGFGAGAGLASQQSDGTVSIVGGQNRHCNPANALSEVFPAFFPDVEFTLDGFFGLSSDNFNCQIASDKAVTVNDKDMHKFTGEISFDDPDDEHLVCPFVAYAVQLESNDAYAYWLVLDDSEPDMDKLAEYAYNMALTFREDEE